MNVLVERYQRRKYVNQPDSQMLYYVRQKSGTVRVMDINKLADAIEANSSLTAGDVKHSIEAFVEQLRLSLTQGDKVKIDGIGHVPYHVEQRRGGKGEGLHGAQYPQSKCSFCGRQGTSVGEYESCHYPRRE